MNNISGFELIDNLTNNFFAKFIDYFTIHAKVVDSNTLHEKSLYTIQE